MFDALCIGYHPVPARGPEPLRYRTDLLKKVSKHVENDDSEIDPG